MLNVDKGKVKLSSTNIIKVRNCELEDFTSIKERSKTWIENRKHWFDSKDKKGTMGCPESLKDILMKHNLRHHTHSHFNLEIYPCDIRENPKCNTNPALLDLFLKKFSLRVYNYEPKLNLYTHTQDIVSYTNNVLSTVQLNSNSRII